MMELNIPHEIRHLKTGIIYPESVTREQLIDHGRFLAVAQKSLNFWRSDWLRKTRQVCGEEESAKICQQLEMEFAEVRAAERLLQLETREEALLPEHHYVLAAANLQVPEQQRWAGLALANKLTPRELRSSIKQGKVVKAEDRDQTHGGVATPHAVRMHYQAWRRQSQEQWSAWGRETLEEAIEQLQPVIDGYRELLELLTAQLKDKEGEPAGQASEEGA